YRLNSRRAAARCRPLRQTARTHGERREAHPCVAGSSGRTRPRPCAPEPIRANGGRRAHASGIACGGTHPPADEGRSAPCRGKRRWTERADPSQLYIRTRRSRPGAFHGAHLAVEVQHVRATCIARRHALNHCKHDLHGIELKRRRLLASGKALCHIGNATQFLPYAFEEIAVRRHLDNVEAEPIEVKFVEIAVESSGVVVWREMRKTPERCCNNEHA